MEIDHCSWCLHEGTHLDVIPATTERPEGRCRDCPTCQVIEDHRKSAGPVVTAAAGTGRGGPAARLRSALAAPVRAFRGRRPTDGST